MNVPDQDIDSKADSSAAAAARIHFAVGILAAIAPVAALYLARAFFVPLLIGVLASDTLRPVVDLAFKIEVLL